MFCDHYDDVARFPYETRHDYSGVRFSEESNLNVTSSEAEVQNESSDTLTCQGIRYITARRQQESCMFCGYDLIDVVTDVFTASPSSPNTSPSRKADVCGRLPPVTAVRNGS